MQSPSLMRVEIILTKGKAKLRSRYLILERMQASFDKTTWNDEYGKSELRFFASLICVGYI